MDANTSPWRDRRVLVTGCMDFLGAAVTRELLDRGAHVVGLVRDRAGGMGFAAERDAGRFRPILGRVEDGARLHCAMAIHEVSAVFHLTAAGALGNDRGTDAILRAAALYHSRLPVVMARPAGQLRLLRHDDQLSPALGVARFGELFGGGDREPSGVVGRTIIGLLAGKPVPIADNRTHDFVFVRDAARACLSMAEAVGARGESLDFTFRSGWEYSERAMAGVVADVFAGKQPAEELPRAPDNPLEWRPSSSLGAALSQTIAWYRDSVRAGAPGTRILERTAA